MRHLTEEEDEDDEGESDSEMEEKKEESADGESQVEVGGEEGDRERLLAAGPSDTGWSVGEPTEVKGLMLDLGDAVETGAEGERQSAYLALTIQSPGAASNAAAGSLSVEQEGMDMREDEAGGVGVMPQRLSFDTESGSGVPRKREGRGYERAAGRQDEDNEGGRVLEGTVKAGMAIETNMVGTEAKTAANDCDSLDTCPVDQAAGRADAGETGGEIDTVDVSAKATEERKSETEARMENGKDEDAGSVSSSTMLPLVIHPPRAAAAPKAATLREASTDGIPVSPQPARPPREDVGANNNGAEGEKVEHAWKELGLTVHDTRPPEQLSTPQALEGAQEQPVELEQVDATLIEMTPDPAAYTLIEMTPDPAADEEDTHLGQTGVQGMLCAAPPRDAVPDEAIVESTPPPVAKLFEGVAVEPGHAASSPRVVAAMGDRKKKRDGARARMRDSWLEILQQRTLENRGAGGEDGGQPHQGNVDVSSHVSLSPQAVRTVPSSSASTSPSPAKKMRKRVVLGKTKGRPSAQDEAHGAPRQMPAAEGAGSVGQEKPLKSDEVTLEPSLVNPHESGDIQIGGRRRLLAMTRPATRQVSSGSCSRDSE